MCTYNTEQTDIEGSAKGRAGWVPVTRATVYYDHPVHARADHALNIDLIDPARGPGDRVALELTARSALALVDAIHAALAAVPTAITGLPEETARRVADLAALAAERAAEAA
ncbi:DUF6295 family protein [Pseudonocardia lacus]|uniref:DUF6295 family protein n=1 Tax=Pseudonocardia lacus TaxID=2835865 RepID=UPI002027899D|nr:DUF6295 family protein [Pseudonocardia lacus]